MSAPTWNGRHYKGAMKGHRAILRAEAEERQRVYDAAHQSPRPVLDLTGGEALPGGALLVTDPQAIKLLKEIFTAPEKDQVIQDAGEIAIADTKPRRRRRNVTRQHKAE